MPLRLQGVFAYSLLVATLAWACPSAAQNDASTRATARQLGSDGVQQYEAGNFTVASDRLERAYQLLHVPSIGLWSARALVKVGKLVEANERYVEVQRLPLSGDTVVQRQAQADAQADAKLLEPRIPTLTINVTGPSGPDLKVTVDGATIPNAVLGVRWLVNPGEHVVAAQSGQQSASARVTATEGENKAVTLTPKVGGTTAPAALVAPPLSPAPANPGPATPTAPPGEDPRADAPTATLAATSVQPVGHRVRDERVRFGLHAALGYISVTPDGASEATTGTELAVGGGLRIPVASHFEIDARLFFTYDSISADNSYEETDYGVAIDGTARWLVSSSSPSFYLGAGPQFGYGTFSGSLTDPSLGYTYEADGKYASVAGLLELGVLFGRDAEWDVGLRGARGISQCLEDECTSAASLSLITLGAGRSF